MLWLRTGDARTEGTDPAIAATQAALAAGSVVASKGIGGYHLSCTPDDAAAVAMLVNHLGRRGKSLPAGSLVLSGGATEAVSVQAGDHVRLRVQGMGSVSLRFV